MFAVRESGISIFQKLENQLNNARTKRTTPRKTTQTHSTMPLTAKKTITGTVNAAAPSFFLSICRSNNHARNQAACAGLGSSGFGGGVGAGAGFGCGRHQGKIAIIFCLIGKS
jgi:hypothetical protein